MPINLKKILQSASQAAPKIAGLTDRQRQKFLKQLAQNIEISAKTILLANQKDLAGQTGNRAFRDRLVLNPERIKSMVNDLRQVANLPTRLNKILSQKKLQNGLKIKQLMVPIGLIGIIYEARPNVTLDSFALAFKSGNIIILRGGSEAYHTNLALVAIIRKNLDQSHLPVSAVSLLPPNRALVKKFLQADQFLDLIIPRGGQGLIKFVRQESTVPVIETGAGIVHVYLDKDADPRKAAAIVANAKCQRPTVCNALDTLIVHQQLLPSLSEITKPLAENKVQILADQPSFQTLREKYPHQLLSPATKADFGTEFLSLKMSIKTVPSLTQALAHISQFSSRHSEAIISENKKTCRQFLELVDAAAVYANASTRFTDGAQFGLGAEIGISTQKIHARGPMGLQALTTYKWIIQGDGQIRN